MKSHWGFIAVAFVCSTAAAADLPTVTDENLGQLWKSTGNNAPGRPKFSSEQLRKHEAGCAKVAYTVGSDGKVSNVSLIKAYPTENFGAVAVTSVRHWAYRPTAANSKRQAVNTAATLTWVVGSNAQADANRRKAYAICDAAD